LQLNVSVSQLLLQQSLGIEHGAPALEQGARHPMSTPPQFPLQQSLSRVQASLEPKQHLKAL
jgi:hypothetical protein